MAAKASFLASWLDFQWCQTGHRGEHLPERVADMWRNLPVKAVANGEHTGGRGRAAGWWQGHEAWSNLCAGGTMGVVYGVGSLWQWVQRVDEPGQAPFFMAPGASWREALDFEGSSYVGLLRRILDGVPTTDMAPTGRPASPPAGSSPPAASSSPTASTAGRCSSAPTRVTRCPCRTGSSTRARTRR